MKLPDKLEINFKAPELWINGRKISFDSVLANIVIFGVLGSWAIITIIAVIEISKLIYKFLIK